MILYVFVVVLFNGFVLMLSILSVMRGLYALGVCERPQSSTDHVRQISLHRFESQTDQTVRLTTEASNYRIAGLRKSKYASTGLVGGRVLLVQGTAGGTHLIFRIEQ